MNIKVTFGNRVVKYGLVDGDYQASTTDIAAGDTLRARVRSALTADGSEAVYKDLTVTKVASDARTITFDRTAANEDFYAEDIAGLHPSHNYGARTAELTVAIPTKTGGQSTQAQGSLVGASAANFGASVAHDSHANQGLLEDAILTQIRVGFPDAYIASNGTDYSVPYAVDAGDAAIQLNTA